MAKDITAIDPCVNFQAYACQGWVDSHEYRADQVSVSEMSILSEKHRNLLRAVLEGSYASNSTFMGSSQLSDEANFKKMKAVYNTCMDESSIKSYGVQPIQKLLKEFETIFPQEQPSSPGIYKAELTKAIAWLAQRELFPLMQLTTGTDNKTPELVLVHFSGGILRLPKAQYKKSSIVTEYAEMIAQMLQIIDTGKAIDNAPASASSFQALASDIVALEKSIARNTADPEKGRDLDVSCLATGV
jgi:endothelin-converting enzyme